MARAGHIWIMLCRLLLFIMLLYKRWQKRCCNFQLRLAWLAIWLIWWAVPDQVRRGRACLLLTRGRLYTESKDLNFKIIIQWDINHRKWINWIDLKQVSHLYTECIVLPDFPMLLLQTLIILYKFVIIINDDNLNHMQYVCYTNVAH